MGAQAFAQAATVNTFFLTLWKNECLGNSGGAIYPLDHVDALDSFESFSVLTWHAVSNDTILLYTK